MIPEQEAAEFPPPKRRINDIASRKRIDVVLTTTFFGPTVRMLFRRAGG
jgi:hypothetical protein